MFSIACWTAGCSPVLDHWMSKSQKNPPHWIDHERTSISLVAPGTQSFHLEQRQSALRLLVSQQPATVAFSAILSVFPSWSAFLLLRMSRLACIRSVVLVALGVLNLKHSYPKAPRPLNNNFSTRTLPERSISSSSRLFPTGIRLAPLPNRAAPSNIRIDAMA